MLILLWQAAALPSSSKGEGQAELVSIQLPAFEWWWGSLAGRPADRWGKLMLSGKMEKVQQIRGLMQKRALPKSQDEIPGICLSGVINWWLSKLLNSA